MSQSQIKDLVKTIEDVEKFIDSSASQPSLFSDDDVDVLKNQLSKTLQEKEFLQVNLQKVEEKNRQALSRIDSLLLLLKKKMKNCA